MDGKGGRNAQYRYNSDFDFSGFWDYIKKELEKGTGVTEKKMETLYRLFTDTDDDSEIPQEHLRLLKA